MLLSERELGAAANYCSSLGKTRRKRFPESEEFPEFVDGGAAANRIANSLQAG